MKQSFLTLLTVALVCILGFGVTSCKDDNDGGKGEGQQPAEETVEETKAFKFYGVVSQLADLSTMDDETYETQTFEPFIGVEDESDPLTRIVATNDMETAALRFADLAGLTLGRGFSATTPSYTYSDPDVGTLKWTKSTDGKSWAEVEVDILQVPHLTKIVYKHPDQMGDNASFSGTAYYRFGDVISREYTSKNGKKVMEYWICVRPAFGPEGKGDTHWISVGELPDDNIFHQAGSNGTDYYVPTKVCTNEEHMQNFAEMLYAIFNPEAWWSALDSRSVTPPKMFHDFDLKNLKLHNQYFWQNVYAGWEAADIARKAFNMNSMAELQQALKDEGLNVLYKGYSWWTTFSWNCELYSMSYTNGTGKEANMHKVKKETLEKNMKDIHFDCRKMGQDVVQYNSFFGADDYTHRWVVRYATGKQLMSSGTFDKYEAIVGCTNVWNYNKQYGPTENLRNTDPIETPAPPTPLETPVVGCIIADDGKFYEKAVPSIKAVAKVVYVGAPGSVEKGKSYRGMAISQTFDETYGLWEASNSTNCQITMTRQSSDFPNILDGIASTTTLANGCGSLDHHHSLAEHCFSLDVIPEEKRRQANLSNWFIPSVGQWILALKGLGMTYNATYVNFSGMTLEQLNAKLNEDGYYFGFDDSFYYYTSTQFGNVGSSTDMYSVFLVDGVPTFYNIPKNKSDYGRQVRPFIAF